MKENIQEALAVVGLSAGIVMMAYGLALLQIQMFTALLTKYAQLSAKLAQFVSDCINDYLLLVSPDMLVITILQCIVSDCQLLAAFVSMCLIHV